MAIRARRILERGSRVPLMLALGVAACVSVATAARAADHPGKAPFDQYCASCHGPAADGTGPVATEMKVAPPDLRKLGQKYGTPLPKPKLRELVDGREMLRAHGTSDMPVWGEQLVSNVPPTANTTFFKRGTIIVILDYLETLQLKSSP
jgi:mono/diheme cytochrome c family protein